jgi:type II secretory pathway pseudopilin PulG
MTSPAGPRASVRSESGFGMIEMVLALAILNVGIFAVMSAFSSSYVTLKRTKTISSASVIVDQQLERFRALSYQSVCISSVATGSSYTINAPTGTKVPTCVTGDPALVPVRDPVIGPDNRLYRTDTYVVWRCIVGTLSTESPYSTATPGCLAGQEGFASQPTKLVRVIVRDRVTTTKIYARAESTFDQSTGL